MERTTLCFVFLFLALHFSDPPINIGRRQSLQPEEYAVYSVIAQTLFITSDTQQLVIEKNIPNNRVDDRKSIRDKINWTFPELQSSTIDDYLYKSRSVGQLNNLFQLPVKYSLIETRETESYFRHGGGRWEAFYKKYPKSPGLLGFSKVGFNQERDQALVYVNLSCGSHCGEGSWILLEKKAGVWAVRDKHASVRS